MNISFSAEEIAFREEVRSFLAEAWNDDLKGNLDHDSPEMKACYIEWHNRLHQKGWLAPAWPKEYGGTDWSVTQHFIFNSERASVGAPAPIPFGVTMVAPVIYTYGSEEQKSKFLPRILNSQDWWCQGYSEPGAGSDLAALQTKAERAGDDYIVSGSKVWTTYAQYADWIFCLVRTDSSGRRQDGISFLLIDMKAPGVSVRPIETIDGVHHLNEVFFDNVRVPVENRIGEEGKGWTYAKSLLVHERLSIAGVADSKRSLSQLRELIRKEVNGGVSLLEDPLIASRLATIEIELMALEYTELRVLASAADGHFGPESSLLKLQGTSIQKLITELQMDVAAYYSQTLQGDLSSGQLGHDYSDNTRKAYFRLRAASIYGGSDEVQKNITARHVLGL